MVAPTSDPADPLAELAPDARLDALAGLDRPDPERATGVAVGVSDD